MSLEKILIGTTIRRKKKENNTDENEMEKFVVAGGIIVNLERIFCGVGNRKLLRKVPVFKIKF